MGLVACTQPLSQKPVPKETVASDGITMKVYDFDGFRPFLEQHDDTLYIINFWATWCKPCVVELPYFEEVNRAYADQPVRVILVSLDFKNQVKKRLIPYVINNNIGSKVIVLHEPDANAWIDKVDPEWDGAIPATVIYRNDNWWFYPKEFKENELKEIVESII